MPLTAVGHNGYRNNTQAQFERTRATFSPWVKPQNPTETVPYRLGKGQIAEVKFLNKRGYKYKIYSEFSDSSVGDRANFGAFLDSCTDHASVLEAFDECSSGGPIDAPGHREMVFVVYNLRVTHIPNTQYKPSLVQCG